MLRDAWVDARGRVLQREAQADSRLTAAGVAGISCGRAVSLVAALLVAMAATKPLCACCGVE